VLKESPVVDAQRVHLAKTALKKLEMQWRLKQKNIQIRLRPDEIEALSILANSIDSRLQLDASLAKEQANLKAVFALPLPFERRFLTLKATLGESKGSASLTGISIGRLPIPESMFWALVNYALVKYVIPDIEKPAQEFVSVVDINANLFSAEIGLPRSLYSETSDAGIITKLSLASLSKPVVARSHHYIQLLTQFSAGKTSVTVLENYVQHVLKEIQVQQRQHHINTELAAGIVALTWFLGERKLDKFIVGYLRLSQQQIEASQHARRLVTLRGRQDLRKHFLFSAYLQLLGSNSASYFIGEVKELSDAISGTGFSFADLQADRAGTLFSHLATRSEYSAQLLVEFGADNQAFELLPSIKQLPEGINKDMFERLYQNTSSEKYLALVNEIDNRISALPLYVSVKQ